MEKVRMQDHLRNTLKERSSFFINSIYTIVQLNPKETYQTFLSTVAKKYDITEPKDWRKVNRELIIKEGSHQLLMHKESPSIIRPMGFWKVQSNRKKFLDELKIQFEIRQPS